MEKENINKVAAETQQKKQRQYWAEHSKRSRKRNKLKKAVSEFCKKLQTSRIASVDKATTASISMQVNRILNLPFRWTDEDLARAYNVLTALEKKYLKSMYTALPEEETAMQELLVNTLHNSKLDSNAKARVALNVLKIIAQDVFVSGADDMEPNQDNLLLLLTQNMTRTAPKWACKELVNLVGEKYQGKNYTDALSEFRKKINIYTVKKNNREMPTDNSDDDAAELIKSLLK